VVQSVLERVEPGAKCAGQDTDLQLALTLGRDDFGRRHGSGTNVMRCAADRAVDTIRERFGGAGVPPPGGSEVVVLTDEIVIRVGVVTTQSKAVRRQRCLWAWVYCDRAVSNTHTAEATRS
jgi:hypothetical protein